MHPRDELLLTALRPLLTSGRAVMRMTELVSRLGYEPRRIKGLSGCAAKAYLEAEEPATRRCIWVWQVPYGITRLWGFRGASRSAVLPNGTTPDGRRHRYCEISSYAKAQELLRQGHSYLDGNSDGEA
jgi:hypothetical protein